MPVDFTVKTPSVDSLVLFLDGKTDKALAAAGEVVAGEVKKRWLAQKGADGSNFRGISKTYKPIKEASGRKPVIDMYFSGAMAASFGTKKVTGDEAVISFSGVDAKGKDNLEKARENFQRRPNMLATDSTLANIASRAFVKFLRAIVRFDK